MVSHCLLPQEMLYRRLMKLNALLSCIRDIDRATKPEKKEAVSLLRHRIIVSMVTHLKSTAANPVTQLQSSDQLGKGVVM